MAWLLRNDIIKRIPSDFDNEENSDDSESEDNFNSLRHDNIDPIIISSDDDDNYSDDEIPDGYQVCYLNT